MTDTLDFAADVTIPDRLSVNPKSPHYSEAVLARDVDVSGLVTSRKPTSRNSITRSIARSAALAKDRQQL